MLPKYFCKINSFIYSIKGKATKLNTNMITSIEINRDLFNYHVTKMEVSALLPRKNILEIIKNYNITTVSLEIQEIAKDTKKDQVISKGIFLKKTFDIIPADVTPEKYLPLGKQDKEQETMNEPMPFVFHLYIKKDVNMMTMNKNIQLKSATPSDALYAMCQLRSVPAGVAIAQKPTVNKAQTSLILETSDLNNNLRDLNEKYGLYNGSPYAFKDYDYLYILDKYVADGMITIPGEATLMTLHVKDQAKVSAAESGYLPDKKKINDSINLVGLPHVSDISDELAHIQKNNVIHVNPSSGATSSKKINAKGGTKLKVVVSTNPNIMKKEAAKLNSLSKSITVSLDNVPPSKFKPYKIFIFKKDPSVKDLKVDGKYKMAQSKVQLLKASDGTLVPTVTLKLIKS